MQLDCTKEPHIKMDGIRSGRSYILANNAYCRSNICRSRVLYFLLACILNLLFDRRQRMGNACVNPVGGVRLLQLYNPAIAKIHPKAVAKLSYVIEVIMTNKEIEQAEKELCDIEKLKKCGGLKKWLDDYGVSYSAYSNNETWFLRGFENAHRFLQTKMMLNACVSASESGELAKRSCRWAAIAASLASLCTIGTWVTVILMLRGA